LLLGGAAVLAAGCTRIAVGGSAGSGEMGSGGGPPNSASTGSATSTSGTSSGGTSDASSGGRTRSPPYQGYDSGPRWEPPIDPGCTAFERIRKNGACFQCIADGDCEPGEYCNPSFAPEPFVCVPCDAITSAARDGCPAGEVCAMAGELPVCLSDCRVEGQGCPFLQYCEGDSGLCSSGCRVDADCRDAGIGICRSTGFSSSCAECIPDAGCGSGEICRDGDCLPDCRDGGTRCAPDTHCDSSTGVCDPGCLNDADCGGSVPFCETDIVPHACAECRTSSDCPPGRPGCGSDPFCSNCPRSCGYCTIDSDCPSPLTCNAGCDCLAPTSCDGFPISPACVGLDPEDGGSTYGVCGCRATSDCGPGLLCDPNQGGSWPGSTGPYIGGGRCVASCATEDAAYCAGMNPDRPVCNPASGFCVHCVADSDCAGDGGPPSSTPACLPDDLDGDVALTGGGLCGCDGTDQCSAGLACRSVPAPGSCVPPCIYDGGFDSCSPGFCDTFTGFCRQCLDDYDCTGQLDPVAGAFSAPMCDASGTCAQCSDSSQCPADLPGCTFGACGYCGTSADCPAGGDLICAEIRDNEYEKQCLHACTLGDDAGLGTVSDAGPSCPAALPFCVNSGADGGGSFCGECRYGANDCDAGQCCGTFCSPNFRCP
jgi:hypothetical protein